MFFKLLDGRMLNTDAVALFVPWKIRDFFRDGEITIDGQLEDIFSAPELVELRALGEQYPGILDSMTIAVEVVLPREAIFIRCDEWQQLKGMIESGTKRPFWEADNKMIAMIRAQNR